VTVAEMGEARSALDRGDWPAALALLRGDDSPEASEMAAQARYANGEFEAAVATWEALYERQLAAGDRITAAWAAANVAILLLVDTGLMAPVRAWVARAERLLDDAVPVPPHAMLAMVRTYERFFCGDPEGARQQAARAMELGRQLNVPPAVILGQVATARLQLSDGAVEEGLAALDDVALSLMSGAVDPMTTGMMYCELVCAAQSLLAYDRAREWTDVMERWAHGNAFGGIHGRCRVHRAELLRISGPGPAAENEAIAACEELRPWMRREFGWPLVELGNIRLRMGDLDGAEEAFLQAHRRAWAPVPGIALLRMEQGDLTAAAELVADAVNNPPQLPWKERPPFGDLQLVPLLDAQSEIAEACGDAETSASAAKRLRSIADGHPSPGLSATAALATAREKLLVEEYLAAVDAANAAVTGWCELDAPFEAAVARVCLGRARERAGNVAGSRLDFRAAHDEFTAFGAVRRATQAAALLAGTGPRVSPTELVASLERRGELWHLGFRGTETVLADLKGLQYLAVLLAEPGREFPALELCGGHDIGDAIPLIDEEARASYRRRLTEVEEDIAEAEEHNDVARAERARSDREFLLAELSGAIGLGGRLRGTGGAAERARTSVTRSLRYALTRLTQQHPTLGEHLNRSVRTGSYCNYQPDTVVPIRWSVSQ
jgi:tetratricopeptide (TPR) repeat protein